MMARSKQEIKPFRFFWTSGMLSSRKKTIEFSILLLNLPMMIMRITELPHLKS